MLTIRQVFLIRFTTPLPDLSIEDNVKEYKNVILLVPKNQQVPDHVPPSAISGDYTEYLCVNKGTEEAPQWDWEQIGTTAADLEEYVSCIQVNNKVLTNKNDSDSNPAYLELGSFASTVASGQATTLANKDSVYANIATDGTLTLGVASASNSVMGVSKMFTGNLTTAASTVTDTAVSVKSAQAMYSALASGKANANNVVSSINGRKGALNICVHNGVSNPSGTGPNGWEGEGNGVSTSTHANLWGTGVYSNTDNNNIVIVDSFVGLPWAYSTDSSYLTLAALPSDAVTVENNFVMNADGKVITTIRPERMFKGFSAKNALGLKLFVGDLSNLTSASFDEISHDTRTFYSVNALETFIGDLSSLTNGSGMFCHCSNLTTFTSDLSSLTNGYIMFDWTNLSLESVECIADIINDLSDDIRDKEDTNWGKITIRWGINLPDESERQALVDELSRIVDKKWTLITDDNLIPLFDSEKYQTGSSTVQPLDLDSEPQTMYYVVKK